MSPSPVKIQKINRVRRVIFLLVALVVVLPYVLRPKPMSYTPFKDARVVFEQVQNLKPGSHVLLSVDYDPTSQAELYPMTQAVLRHCFRNRLVPIVMTHNINGVNLAKELVENAAAENLETAARCLKGASFPCDKKDLIKYLRSRDPEFLKDHIAAQGVTDLLERIEDRTYKSQDDIFSDKLFSRLPQKELVSGRDYVFLGFKTGGAQLILNMGVNIKGAFEADYYSQPTAAMPALKGVNSLKNLDFAVDFTASSMINVWMMFGSDRFGFPLAAGTTAVMAPDLIPFVKSEQIAGYLGGLRGAADYELLLDRPADGVLGMYAQSATHVLVIVLILGANIRLLVQRWSGKRKDR